MLLDCLIAFLGGAFYEACCVGWVHYSERNEPAMTSLFSMACATAQVGGIVESVHNPIAAVFYVLGWGAGTYAAVDWKVRRARSKKG